MVKKCIFENPHGATLPYKIYLPEDMKPGEKYPLIVFLHGYGERGPADGSQVDLVDRYCYIGRAEAGEKFNAIIAAPQCPDTSYWGGYIESLNKFLDMLLDSYPVNANRVALTGLSMGGTATWMWSLADPERFCAVAPVCGSGVYWYGERLVNKPVWAFHGDIDDVVPPLESLNMVNSINKRGGHAKLTLFHGVGHNAWDPAYAGLSLYNWLTSFEL